MRKYVYGKERKTNIKEWKRVIENKKKREEEWQKDMRGMNQVKEK
jgi:hypothetical protein